MIAIPPTEAKALYHYREYYRALARVTRFLIQTSGGVQDINLTVEFPLEVPG